MVGRLVSLLEDEFDVKSGPIPFDHLGWGSNGVMRAASESDKKGNLIL